MCRISPESLLCGTDGCAFRASFAGTNSGQMCNQAPTNKAVSNLWSQYVFKINSNNKITEIFMTHDHLGLFRQLGWVQLPFASTQKTGQQTTQQTPYTTTQSGVPAMDIQARQL